MDEGRWRPNVAGCATAPSRSLYVLDLKVCTGMQIEVGLWNVLWEGRHPSNGNVSPGGVVRVSRLDTASRPTTTPVGWDCPASRNRPHPRVPLH